MNEKGLSRKQIANLWMGTFFVMFVLFLMAGINPVCAAHPEIGSVTCPCSQGTPGTAFYEYYYNESEAASPAFNYTGLYVGSRYYGSWPKWEQYWFGPNMNHPPASEDATNAWILANEICNPNNTTPTPTPTPNMTYPTPTSTVPSPWNGTTPTDPRNLTFPNGTWIVWNYTEYFPNVTSVWNITITNRTNLTNYFNSTLMPMPVVNAWLDFWDWIFSALFSWLQALLDFLLGPIRWLTNLVFSADKMFYDNLNGLLYYLKPVSMFFQKFFYICPPALIIAGTFLLTLDFVWWLLKGRKT